MHNKHFLAALMMMHGAFEFGAMPQRTIKKCYVCNKSYGGLKKYCHKPDCEDSYKKRGKYK